MFRIYMVISSFFCIFISQKAGYGYGRITTVYSSETRASVSGDLLASCFHVGVIFPRKDTRRW